MPSLAGLQEAAATPNACGNVTILAGAGVEGAREEVLALADALGAPIMRALRGKEFIEHDNPFDVGMTGFPGHLARLQPRPGAIDPQHLAHLIADRAGDDAGRPW